MHIKIYSTPSCPWCVLVKSYFKKKNIQFEDFNVAEDQKKAEEMIKISGQTSVPVIKINDQIIIGFDQDKIEEALRTNE